MQSVDDLQEEYVQDCFEIDEETRGEGGYLEVSNCAFEDYMSGAFSETYHSHRSACLE